MIAKGVEIYCCEDLSLIENYDLAIADQTQIWECHHRKETDEGLSRTQLIEMGLYFGRPASELIFLTKAEHTKLHKIGNQYCQYRKLSAETKAKIGAASKGRNSKAVYQIHKATGIIIREWKCIGEAARVLGLHATHISACCKGRLKSTGGFIWRYADDLKSVF